MTKYSLIHNGAVVIGAGGFIGRALSAALFRGSRPRRARGDLTDPRYCRRLLRGARAVYYLAAEKKNSAHHTREPYRYLAGNVQPLLVFLHQLGRSGARTLVYLSTTVVDYPGSADGYAAGKRINEQILQVFARQFPKIDVKVARLPLVYGPGNNFDPAAANFIAAQIVKVARSRRAVEVWGTGRRRMQFLYIDDLVRNLLLARRARGKFFVFGNEAVYRVNEAVGMIIKIFGKKLRIKNNPRKPDKPTKVLRFNNLVTPRVPLEEGLRRTIADYQGLRR